MDWIDRRWMRKSGEDSVRMSMEDMHAETLNWSLSNSLEVFDAGFPTNPTEILASVIQSTHDPRLDYVRVMCILINRRPEAARVIYDAFERPVLDEMLMIDLETAHPGILERLSG